MIEFSNTIPPTDCSSGEQVPVASRATVPLINTPLQRGGTSGAATGNRFNGFGGGLETVETVKQISLSAYTPLKGGVNETQRRAFTLIELLIVIAIMAILAGLIFPVTGALNRRKMIARTKAELGLVKMAIDDYQTKLGHYPPDNPSYYFALSPLYFELMGTTNNGTEFVTLDGSAKIRRPTSGPDFRQAFGSGVQGFANCSATGGGEEARSAQRFLRSDLKPGQVASFANFPNVKLLVCSIPGPYNFVSPPLLPANANPFRYNSSNPTNNPNSYDLWVDIVIAGKTNRINNWSSDPILVATP